MKIKQFLMHKSKIICWMGKLSLKKKHDDDDGRQKWSNNYADWKWKSIILIEKKLVLNGQKTIELELINKWLSFWWQFCVILNTFLDWQMNRNGIIKWKKKSNGFKKSKWLFLISFPFLEFSDDSELKLELKSWKKYFELFYVCFDGHQHVSLPSNLLFIAKVLTYIPFAMFFKESIRFGWSCK